MKRTDTKHADAEIVDGLDKWTDHVGFRRRQAADTARTKLAALAEECRGVIEAIDAWENGQPAKCQPELDAAQAGRTAEAVTEYRLRANAHEELLDVQFTYES